MENSLISVIVSGQTTQFIYDSAGNLDVKAGVDLNFNDAVAHKHAVTHIGTTQQYWYDANGNQSIRIVNGQTFNLSYDAENRLVSVSGAATASFVYDGDGNRVQATVAGITTTFVGSHYEVTGSQVTKYYTSTLLSAGFAGTQRVAVKKYVIPQNPTLTYLLGDHLGSTALAVDASTGEAIETRYRPWGEVRYTTPNKTLPTQYTFTGQYSYIADEATDLGSAGFGLLFYNARFYDPAIGRFISADSIVPGGVQGYDRYAYTNNNPVRYTDPSGHRACGDGEEIDCEGNTQDPDEDPHPYEPPDNSEPEDDGDPVVLLPGQCSGSGCPIDSSVPSGPACTYTFSCYIPSYCIGNYYYCGENQSLRTPDYYNFTLGLSIPGLGSYISVAPTVTLDRFGNIYGGAGISGGPEAPLGIAPSLVGGWISDGPPSEDRSEQFLSGVYINASGGGVVGGGWNWNPIGGGHSWDFGAYWPQGSITVGGTGYYDAHRQEPLWNP